MTDLAWIGWLSELLAAPGATAAGVAVELGYRTDQNGAADQLRILAPSIPGAHEASVLRGRDGRPDVALVILGAGEALRLGDLEGALGPAEELGGSTSPLRSVALPVAVPGCSVFASIDGDDHVVELWFRRDLP